MDDTTSTFLTQHPWVENGKFLERTLRNSDSAQALAEVLRSCLGLGNSRRAPSSISAVVDTFCHSLFPMDAPSRFATISILLLGKTTDEVSVADDSTPQRVERSLQSGLSVAYASFTGETPWRSTAWIRSLLAGLDASERRGAAILIRAMIVIAEGLDVDQTGNFPWESLFSNGYKSTLLTDGNAQLSTGYATPEWLKESIAKLSHKCNLIAWQQSVRGPILVGSANSSGFMDPTAAALLSWADAVQYDQRGPISAILWLDEELTENHLKARLLSALLAGAAVPFTLLLALPSTKNVATSKWASYSLDDDMLFDQGDLKLASAPQELSAFDVSPVQETWHIYGGAVSNVLLSLTEPKRTSPLLANGIWAQRIARLTSANKVRWADVSKSTQAGR